MSLRARQPDAVRHLRTQGAEQLLSGLDDAPEDYLAIAQQGDPTRLSEMGSEASTDVSWEPRHFATPSRSLRMLTRSTSSHRCNTNTRSTSKVAPTICCSRTIHASGFMALTHPRFTLALPIDPYTAFVATGSDAAYNSLRRLPRESLLVHLNASAIDQARARIYALNKSARKSILDHPTGQRAERQIASSRPADPWSRRSFDTLFACR